MRDERLPGAGYLPASISPHQEHPNRVVVDWADFRGVALDEAFFGWTVRRMIAGGGSLLQTDVAELLRFHRRLGARPPAGFVSHMTRCGSTLLARALHCLPRTACLSEPPPLNAALLSSLWPSTPEAPFLRRELLKATILAFTHERQDGPETVFFKTSFGTGRMAAALKELWPGAPIVFLFRDPLEVLASWETTGGPTTDLARNFFGDGAVSVNGQVDIEATARILGRICEQAIEDAASIDAFIDYDDLSGRGLFAAMIAAGARPDLVAGVQPRIEECRRADAKRSGHVFQPDGANKRAAASEKAREAASRHLAAPFAELRRLRTRAAGFPGRPPA